MKSSFSMIMTPSIHPEEPRSGLRSKVSSFLTGLLSPIEHTWDHLKRCLSGYERAPTGVHQLWDRVVVELWKISVEECQK